MLVYYSSYIISLKVANLDSLKFSLADFEGLESI